MGAGYRLRKWARQTFCSHDWRIRGTFGSYMSITGPRTICDFLCAKCKKTHTGTVRGER